MADAGGPGASVALPELVRVVASAAFDELRRLVGFSFPFLVAHRCRVAKLPTAVCLTTPGIACCWDRICGRFASCTVTCASFQIFSRHPDVHVHQECCVHVVSISPPDCFVP